MYGIAIEAKDMNLPELLDWSEDVAKLMNLGMPIQEADELTPEECKREVVRRNTELCKQCDDISEGKQR
ncbi:MAG TPA: hypothetical protein ENH94_06335 [Phycisphaerales bacterium]|nr:hypothetical protein [Phycisphaerales bacterium]